MSDRNAGTSARSRFPIEEPRNKKRDGTAAFPPLDDFLKALHPVCADGVYFGNSLQLNLADLQSGLRNVDRPIEHVALQVPQCG